MKKALLCFGAFIALCFGEEFSLVKETNRGEEITLREYKTSEFMLKKAIIKGDDVNLRMLPRISSTALNAANTGDEFIAESVAIFDEQSGLYWLKIVNADKPLFVAEKFVELKELSVSEKESLKNQKLFTGVKAKKPSGKKYGSWRDFAEEYPYKLGGNIHDMVKNWGNGTLKRICYKNDSSIDHCIDSEFSADGVVMNFMELYPDTPSREMIYRTTNEISKNGYEIAGIKIGKTTKDEAIKLYGKPYRFANENIIIYPNYCEDDEKGGCEEPSQESLFHHNFTLKFNEKSGVLESISIDNLPWD